MTDLTPAQLAEKINLVMFYDELTEDDWPAAVAALSELRARATALDAERTRNRELEQFGTIRSRREAEARAKNAEAALDAERARADNYEKATTGLSCDVTEMGEKIERLEAVAEAARKAPWIHAPTCPVRRAQDQRCNCGIQQVFDALVHLDAALAVLEEPQ